MILITELGTIECPTVASRDKLITSFQEAGYDAWAGYRVSPSGYEWFVHFQKKIGDIWEKRRYSLRLGVEGNYGYSARTTIEKAAKLGWKDGQGVAILDRLQVGETAVDIDGDTWERVE